MANQRRLDQVAEQIKHLLGDLIQKEIKDPRLGFVTITEVTLSTDMTHATANVSVMGDEETRAASLAVLNRARGFLRREVGKHIRVRVTPELHFALDTSLDASEHMTRLFQQVNEQRQANPPKIDEEEA